MKERITNLLGKVPDPILYVVGYSAGMGFGIFIALKILSK